MLKKVVAIITAIILVMQSPPQVAYAATSVVFDISKGSISINDDTYSGYSSTGTELSGTSSGKAFTVTGATTTNTVTVAGTQNITLSNCNIDVSATTGACAFKIVDDNNGTVTVNLASGTTNTLYSSAEGAGLQKNGAVGALIIQGEGKLIAKSFDKTTTLKNTDGAGSAGIGSSKRKNSCNIYIKNGIIVASGSNGYSGGADHAGAAGIGSGQNGSVDNIQISGGTITAIGREGSGAAGIGGGHNGKATNIIITGGSIKAVGSSMDTINGDTGEYEKTVIAPGIGTGVLWTKETKWSFENGSTVEVTNGSERVYLFTLFNTSSSSVYVDSSSYTPINHTKADSSDTNLYMYLTAGPHTIKCGTVLGTYEHFIDGDAWHNPTSSTSINYGQSLSSSTISSDVIDEHGYALSGSWSWTSPTEIPNGAGKHTYRAEFKKGG